VAVRSVRYRRDRPRAAPRRARDRRSAALRPGARRPSGAGSPAPCHDLGEAERLRHVVVAAGAQRLDLVLGRVLRGQEEDGGPVALGAQASTDLDAVDVRQHPVEDDQIGLERRDRAQRLSPCARLLDLVALVAQGGGHGVDDRRLVVDDEDPVLRPGLSGDCHRSDPDTGFCESAESVTERPAAPRARCAPPPAGSPTPEEGGRFGGAA
jgi:hypothetical protein